MNETSQTITGWILLLVGLIIIGVVLYSSLNIFTGKKNPPQLFSAPEIASPQEAETEAEQMVQEKLDQMIPSKNITKLLNLISWGLLAGIFIFGGSKISSLGIRLVKK